MSPHPDFCRRRFSAPRPWEVINPQPFSDVPDLSRAELRLAAEVSLAELGGQLVPTFARERAMQTLEVLARA